MAEFRFAGPYASVYPELRDALDRPVSRVEPGDVREFDEAPDPQWVPADASPPAPGPEPAPVPDGPQPAPPAVVPPAGPQPFAVTPDQQ